MKNNKLLITGGGGFIGSHLANYFSKKYEVFSTYFSKKTLYGEKKINFIQLDLRKKFKIDTNIEILIHCASVTPAKFNQKKCYQDNIKINKNLFLALKKSNVKKIIFLSSISVYDKNNLNILNDNTKAQTSEPYGKSKIDFEKKLKKLSNKKIKVVILRLSSIIGKGSHGNFLSILKRNISSKKKKVLFYNRDKLFNSCMHISNLCKLIDKLIKKKINKDYITFNIHSSKPLKIFQIINLFIKKLSTNKNIFYSNAEKPSYVVKSDNLVKYKIKIKSTKSNILKYLNNF